MSSSYMYTDAESTLESLTARLVNLPTFSRDTISTLNLNVSLSTFELHEIAGNFN